MSDLHLEHAALDVPSVDCDLVVLAGDIDVGDQGIIWAMEQFPDIPVLYIPGNHEYYFGEVGLTLDLLRRTAAGSNVRVLERESFVFEEVRFIGATLWTDFRLFSGGDEYETMWAKVDARKWVPDYDGRIHLKENGCDIEVSPEVTQCWHQQTVDWLSIELAKPFAGKTVVVSHHAPSARSIPAEYAKNKATPAYASHLDELVALSDLWIHGHVHSSANYSIGSSRVLCNPRGYGSENIHFETLMFIDQ